MSAFARRPAARHLAAAVVACALMAGVAGCAGDGDAPAPASGRAAPPATAAPAPAPAPADRPPVTARDDAPATAPERGGVLLRARVARVVDGDTLQVRSGGFDDTVRLIGVDAPETRHPGRPVGCWGPEASAAAARLLPPGAAVRLRTDPTQDRRDRYGRLLAHAYTGDRDGADSVNRALVAAGAARVYVYRGQPFTHLEAFRRAEADARRAGRGLWGPPCRGRGAPSPSPGPAAPPAAPRPAGDCDPGYTGACVPPYPPDVDCDDIGRAVTVIGADPHRLDGDGNGIGCDRFAGAP